jgi:hypothetical protein
VEPLRREKGDERTLRKKPKKILNALTVGNQDIMQGITI